MPFRFLHTADLHLDSPLVSLALRNADLADLVRGASRRALERIVDIAIAEEVDALLIAGDLYDGAQTSMSTALFLVSEMRRLETAGIRVFVIRGNHDAQSQITRELTFPPNVHVFDGRVVDAAVHKFGCLVELNDVAVLRRDRGASGSSECHSSREYDSTAWILQIL